MTTMKLHIAGPINRVDIKQAAAKTVAEVSICKKNRGRQGEEDTFTWVRATIWEPPEWMCAKLVKGAMVALSGDFSLRSFNDKDGNKKTSAEIRCTSFDVEVGGSDEQEAAPAPRRSRPAQGASSYDDSQPPFAPLFDIGA